MEEEDIVPLILASLSDSYVPLINAVETRQNLTLNYISNKRFDEGNRMEECKEKQNSTHSVFHTQGGVNCF